MRQRKGTKARSVIDPATKIFIYTLYLQGIKYKKVAEYSKVPFNSVKTIIYRMKKGY